MGGSRPAADSDSGMHVEDDDAVLAVGYASGHGSVEVEYSPQARSSSTGSASTTAAHSTEPGASAARTSSDIEYSQQYSQQHSRQYSQQHNQQQQSRKSGSSRAGSGSGSVVHSADIEYSQQSQHTGSSRGSVTHGIEVEYSQQYSQQHSQRPTHTGGSRGSSRYSDGGTSTLQQQQQQEEQDAEYSYDDDIDVVNSSRHAAASTHSSGSIKSGSRVGGDVLQDISQLQVRHCRLQTADCMAYHETA